MMRILVVDEEIPYPPNSGKRLRTFNLMKHLAPRHRITWLAREHQNIKAERAPFEALGIKCVIIGDPIPKKSGLRFYGALLKNLFSRYPYVVSSHQSFRLIEAARSILSSESYDLVHCEWTPYAINLLPFLPRPSVVVAHNIESMIWERNLRVEKNRLVRLFLWLQWRRMLRFEEDVFRRFSGIVVVSEADRAWIQRWIPSNQVTVVPNGVDTEYFCPQSTEAMPYSMVFTGSLDWRPNVDAVNYFLDEIWPLVEASHPESTFTVAGRQPLPKLREKLKNWPGVTLRDSPADMRPILAPSSVCIVPLRIGGGSRLKILEAFAMKKAVVSTTIGAEGLEVESERHLLLADDPQDFARAVQRLFDDPSLRMRLASEGHALVHRKYRWGEIAALMEEMWLQTAQGTR